MLRAQSRTSATTTTKTLNIQCSPYKELTHTHNRYKTYCIFSIKLRTESRPIRIDLCSRFLFLSCFADFGCVSLQIGLENGCLGVEGRGFAPVDAVELNVSVRLDIGGSDDTNYCASQLLAEDYALAHMRWSEKERWSANEPIIFIGHILNPTRDRVPVAANRSFQQRLYISIKWTVRLPSQTKYALPTEAKHGHWRPTNLFINCSHVALFVPKSMPEPSPLPTYPALVARLQWAYKRKIAAARYSAKDVIASASLAWPTVTPVWRPKSEAS